MRNEDRSILARRHLDLRVNQQAAVGSLQRPPRGWVKAIREALGMTTAQLARRMGVAQPSVVSLEASEAHGRIRLDTLERAALALDCQLVYALVPNQPLDALVQLRRRELAERQLASVEQSMRLENQSVESKTARGWQLNQVSERIDARYLWDEK